MNQRWQHREGAAVLKNVGCNLLFNIVSDSRSSCVKCISKVTFSRRKSLDLFEAVTDGAHLTVRHLPRADLNSTTHVS